MIELVLFAVLAPFKAVATVVYSLFEPEDQGTRGWFRPKGARRG